VYAFEEATVNFAAGIALGIPLGLIAYKLKYLDKRATAVSILFSGLYFTGGVGLYLPSLAFFFSSSLATRLAYTSKKSKGAAEREEGRSVSQVIGAGLVAAVLTAMYGILADHRDKLLVPTLAVLASSSADTWAAEVGALYRGKPRLITRPGIEVEPGTSGGVTPLGTLGAVSGSAVVGLVALLESALGILPLSAALIPQIVLLGWLGEVFDSVIGATLQVKYYCPRCRTLTDKPVHLCGEKTVRVGGLPWVTNESTNLLATGIVALLGLVLQTLL